MKKFLFCILSLLFFWSYSVLANGDRRHEAEYIPPPPCIPQSPDPKVQIVSWEPDQKVSKIIGSIQECVTGQWDVLRLFSGPNILGIDYPSEKEKWCYHQLWSYKLEKPLDQTVIMMDLPGRRIRKGKKPVELCLIFNDRDIVERVEMTLVKENRY